MNKAYFLMFFLLQCCSLLAMKKSNSFGDLICVDCHNQLDDNVKILPDESYGEVPDRWKNVALDSLKNVANSRNEQDRALDIAIDQYRRHENIWRVINMLQSKNPDKIWITINRDFAEKHSNAFLYYETRVSTVADLDDLVKKVRDYMASPQNQ
jgi:hypothetical protein